jgi:hypothetical protein
MATVILSPAPRKSCKPFHRSVRLRAPPSDDNPFAIIGITVGTKADDYYVRPIASDFGRAFRVEKVLDPERAAYHVCLNGRESACDCLGHARYGFCKHVSALKALVQAGML